MPLQTRDNERSWAIELISEINRLCSTYDWKIKKAGGERTVSISKTPMFPDVMLFGDSERSFVLQGWELKMPDVPIEDEAFIKDAQRKALALNLNSCLLWNFSYAVLYIKNEDGSFRKAKAWNSTAHIRTRQDVATYINDWKTLLDEVLCFINGYLVSGTIRSSSLVAALSDSILTELIKRNKHVVSQHLRQKANDDVTFGAYITLWWLGIHSEYAKDETNEFDAYAKTIILNWAIRILFAHIIKTRQNSALLIDAFDERVTPSGLNRIFDDITSRCDFYNIFAPLKGDEYMPDASWRDLVDFSKFIKNHSIQGFDQGAFQRILEETVARSRRELNGQYTTPETLAEILLRLTVNKWEGDILDCCCGTGTIPQKAIAIKQNKFGIEEAIKHVWACDKYSYPLQVANVSMSRPETINFANLLFKHNALSLKPGEEIVITDPSNGVKNRIPLPLFDAVVSNLPFVTFEHIPEDDKGLISCDSTFSHIDGRTDLFAYIALHLDSLLAEKGRAGIITSNSWLASNGGAFVDYLEEHFHILQVHISGKRRWFKNADVVTTLLILEKKNSNHIGTSFVLWKKSLEEFKESIELKEKLINGSILNRNDYPDIYNLTSYGEAEISSIHSMNVSYNVLFHDVTWLPRLRDRLIPVNSVFRVFRGSRRGWDPLFYPKKGTHSIDAFNIQPVLINARNVDYLEVDSFDDAFCCEMSIQELEQMGAQGTLEWIRSFEHQRNGVGKLLPDVLAKSNIYWYQLQRNEIAEIFTMMNPDKRFFYGKCSSPAFINQRLIGLTRKNPADDLDLLHALLNSVLSYFYIEASGFGRGLGVLDINKSNIENCLMLNPGLLSSEDSKAIKEKFQTLKQRKILSIFDELDAPDRLAFERTVFSAFGIDGFLSDVLATLKSMVKTRGSVRN